MSRKTKRTLPQAWADLQHQRENGKPQPSTRPAHLGLRQIKLWPEVFQHRAPGKHASAAHIKDLASKAGERPLDPVVVWWDGRGWACIDGHHRVEAYKRARQSDLIPVEAFEGTPEQAMLEAAKRNTRSRLQMGHTEKLHAAWRLVTSTRASKSDTAQVSGVSERTVANMRRVREALVTAGKDPSNLGWHEARLMAAGEKPNEKIDWDARTEEEAQAMANKLLAAFGKRAGQRVDALARALEIYSSQLPAQLLEVWGTADRGEDL